MLHAIHSPIAHKINSVGVKCSMNSSMTIRICTPNIRYANKYDARNFLNSVFMVGVFGVTKISGGTILGAWTKA